MKKIVFDGSEYLAVDNDVLPGALVYAIFGDVHALSQGTTFIGAEDERLQFSVLRYDKGKILQNHIHKYRPRVIEKTQEAWVVLSGSATAHVFNEEKENIYSEVITAGQFFISYRGGHGYEILSDDTIVIELKLGDFIGVEQDKEKF